MLEKISKQHSYTVYQFAVFSDPALNNIPSINPNQPETVRLIYNVSNNNIAAVVFIRRGIQSWIMYQFVDTLRQINKGTKMQQPCLSVWVMVLLLPCITAEIHSHLFTSSPYSDVMSYALATSLRQANGRAYSEGRCAVTCSTHSTCRYFAIVTGSCILVGYEPLPGSQTTPTVIQAEQHVFYKHSTGTCTNDVIRVLRTVHTLYFLALLLHSSNDCAHVIQKTHH